MGIYARVAFLILRNMRILRSFSISTFSLKTFLQQHQVSHSSTQNEEHTDGRRSVPKPTPVSNVAELHIPPTDIIGQLEISSPTELRTNSETELRPIRYYQSRSFVAAGNENPNTKTGPDTTTEVDLEQAEPVANRNSHMSISENRTGSVYPEVRTSRRTENKAAWNYTKVAFLMYTALLIVWVSQVRERDFCLQEIIPCLPQISLFLCISRC